VRRFLALFCAFCLLATGQQIPTIRTTVKVVVVPVTVTDGRGEFVTDLVQNDFAVFDNGAPQKMETFELSSMPLSLAIVVETSTRIAPVLPDVRKSGILFTQLILGESGEASIITYDQRVEIAQEFTTNGDLIEKGIKGLKAGGSEARMTDAVFRAIGRLKMRPADRRKVVFLIGEGADSGSENDLGQALREAQLSAISVYCVDLSTMKIIVKQPAPGTRVDPLPPGARGTRPGIPPAPQGASGGNLMPLIVEAVRGVKAIFVRPMKAYTEGTGAEHISVSNEKSFQEAVHRIGQELHSQYMISYQPNNLVAAEFHNITVRLTRSGGLKVRARPGYFYVPAEGTVPIDSKPEPAKKTPAKNGPTGQSRPGR